MQYTSSVFVVALTASSLKSTFVAKYILYHCSGSKISEPLKGCKGMVTNIRGNTSFPCSEAQLSSHVLIPSRAAHYKKENSMKGTFVLISLLGRQHLLWYASCIPAVNSITKQVCIRIDILYNVMTRRSGINVFAVRRHIWGIPNKTANL